MVLLLPRHLANWHRIWQKYCIYTAFSNLIKSIALTLGLPAFGHLIRLFSQKCTLYVADTISDKERDTADNLIQLLHNTAFQAFFPMLCVLLLSAQPTTCPLS